MPTSLLSLLGDLVSVNQRLTRLAARATGSSESPAVWRTLSVLNSGGPMRLGELAELSRVAQPTATKLVSNLTERGWVNRLADPDDARASQIAVTTAGADALIAWRDELAGAMLPLFADLDTDDVAVLRRAVEIIGQRADAAADLAPGAPVTAPPEGQS
ncbi:MarR family transcriptional regulator [Salinibacterium sp. NSLL150]|uniref:MarR family winged helix-turn-helix transcriptional regulator n=1 Tax=unclassified Salinibacterium TaxID=2632331 RepID=UPI0018CE6F15|nr:MULTISPECIES: MarR family transcriptional regulator [unclassified Salinibacterium]MBH0098592.1 MarR family transcriptional regulator [Salinibacterium sp. NSLL35]MBH0101347.1 MarR family transcriptional regulator [Salinibacterium sp. NSLL150]MBH0104106.1 MarR family transcriptional regulator [Salinibacterium sp. NSLL16]MBH0106867.1 MarR family transcriptional regulator [Salinibacterium sp. NSLL17]